MAQVKTKRAGGGPVCRDASSGFVFCLVEYHKSTLPSQKTRLSCLTTNWAAPANATTVGVAIANIAIARASAIGFGRVQPLKVKRFRAGKEGKEKIRIAACSARMRDKFFRKRRTGELLSWWKGHSPGVYSKHVED